jgi:hypothetical protein
MRSIDLLPAQLIRKVGKYQSGYAVGAWENALRGSLAFYGPADHQFTFSRNRDRDQVLRILLHAGEREWLTTKQLSAI